jgi:hypothetical protein
MLPMTHQQLMNQHLKMLMINKHLKKTTKIKSLNTKQ